MKKEYEMPEMEVLEFETEDVMNESENMTGWA